MAKYDIIIKNGLVFSGRGDAPQMVDVAVSGKKISKIDNLKNVDADIVLDASGKYVCPGFIDLANYSDTHWSLFTNPYQESVIRQGITTIIGGNCGFSLAPLIGEAGLKRSEADKININWQTVGEFFTELEKKKIPVNFATFVGYNTLHYGIVGNQDVSPSDEQMEQLKFLLDKSMKEGSFGLSVNMSLASHDRELLEMFGVVAKNNGMVKYHLEDEGKDVLPSISRIINLGRETIENLRLHISHFKILGRGSWNFFDSALGIIKNARESGVALTGDFFPYEKTGSNLFMLLPPWLRKMNSETIKEILSSKENEMRRETIGFLKKITLHYDKIIIASSSVKSSTVGRTLKDVSESVGLSPEETIVELLLRNDLTVSMFNDVISEDHIKKLAVEDYFAVGTDSVGYDIPESESDEESLLKLNLPHPRSFGAFPKFLRWLVKENKILSWEKAINKITGLPAQILGLNDRGLIKHNYKADIVILDPEKLTDRSTYEKPFQLSEGIEKVIVNGKIIFDGDKIIDISAGEVLRKGK